MIQERAQHFLERTHLWGHAINQHVHVQAKPRFQIRIAEQHAHHDFWIDGFCAWLQNNADVVSRFVADIGQQWYFLQLDNFGQLFNQLRLLNLIRNFGNDDLPCATAKVFDLPLCAQTERAAPRTIGVRDIFRRLNNHTAGREIWTGDIVQQRIVTSIRRFDQMQTCVDQFVQVMRRNVRRHTNSDPA